MTKKKKLLPHSGKKKIHSAIGGKMTPDNSEVDIIKGNHAIEIRLELQARKIVLRCARKTEISKTAFAAERGMQGHTASGIDLKSGTPKIYHRQGFGQTAFSSMERVSLSTLRVSLKNKHVLRFNAYINGLRRPHLVTDGMRPRLFCGARIGPEASGRWRMMAYRQGRSTRGGIRRHREGCAARRTVLRLMAFASTRPGLSNMSASARRSYG